MQPRALLLENVRGLATNRFASYRQRVLDRLMELGYVADWRLLHAADFGLPQLRPRFVLVAMRPDDAAYFRWPEPRGPRVTVGEALRDMMAANGWPFAEEWAQIANSVGPTLVGGSKKHGGADLGPTRAKQAWAALGVDGKGIADEAPRADWPHPSVQAPRLTIEMVARLQGWTADIEWKFAGEENRAVSPDWQCVSTSGRRGNRARDQVRTIARGCGSRNPGGFSATVHDPIYRALARAVVFVSMDQLLDVMNRHSRAAVERRLAILSRDFDLEERSEASGLSYKLGQFKGFVGQDDHTRHDFLRSTAIASADPPDAYSKRYVR